MADPGAQQILEQAMLRNELAKLPVWFGDPTKDAFRPEDWWRRFELAAVAANWNWGQIQAYFDQALRGPAILWYRYAIRQDPPANINDIKHMFLEDYGRTATARTSVAQLRITQKQNEKVRDYMARVQQAMDEIELSVPALPVPTIDQIFPDRPAVFDPPAGAVALAYFQAQFARMTTLGYQRLYNPLFRNIFIDGLQPAIRDEVIRHNPPTLREAFTFAKQAERDFDLKSSLATAAITSQEETVNAFIRRPTKNNSGNSAPNTNVPNRTRPNTNNPNVTCHYCEKKGHIQRDCFKRQREKGAYKQPPRRSVRELEEQDKVPEAAQPPEDTTPPEIYTTLMGQINALNW